MYYFIYYFSSSIIINVRYLFSALIFTGADVPLCPKKKVFLRFLLVLNRFRRLTLCQPRELSLMEFQSYFLNLFFQLSLIGIRNRDWTGILPSRGVKANSVLIVNFVSHYPTRKRVFSNFYKRFLKGIKV